MNAKIKLFFGLLLILGFVNPYALGALPYPKGSACYGIVAVPAIPGAQLHKPPTVTETTYHAIYEYINKSKDTPGPTLLEENVDIEDKLYSVTLKLLGTNATYLTDGNTNQVYVFDDVLGSSGTVCEVGDNSTHTFLQNLPNISVLKHNAYYLQQLLSIDQKYYKGYSGSIPNKERGMDAEFWQYCIDKTVRIATYWSKLDTITHAGQGKRIPLWIEIYYPNKSDAETINIFHFKRFQVDKSALVTPPGVYCPGRKSLKKFPIDQMRLSAFKFRGEEYIKEDKYIGWSNHWYDSGYQLRRVDYPAGLDGDGVDSQIMVYQSGYGYEINRDEGTCICSKIKDMTDYGSIFSDASVYSDPQSMFGPANTTYIYVGQRYIRNIKAEVYQALRHHFPLDYDSKIISVVEMFLVQPIYGGQYVPVGMSITPYNDTSLLFKTGDSLLYYFYDWYAFSAGESDLNDYDISLCFPDSQKAQLIATLNVTKGTLPSPKTHMQDTLALINNQFVLNKLRMSLSFGAGIDTLKVTQLKPYVNSLNNEIYISFTILGLMPNLDIGHPNLNESVVNVARAINSGHVSIETQYLTKDMAIQVVPNSLKNLATLKQVEDLYTTTAPVTTTTSMRTTTTTTPRKPTTTTRKPTTTTRKPTTRARKPSTTPKKPSTTPKKSSTSKQPSTSPKIQTTPSPKQKSKSEPLKSKAQLFSSGTLGGAAIGSLLGGLVMGAILTFVQVKFFGGKFFGIQVL